MLTTWQEEEKEREEGEEESIAEKEKEKLCHTIYRLWKISNNGLQSFFFLRLIFIVHPSTDGLPYGLKNELASRVNYILHWRMDRSEPWPTYRALREFESQSHTTNRSNPVQLESVIRSSFNNRGEIVAPIFVQSSSRFSSKCQTNLPIGQIDINWYAFSATRVTRLDNTIRSIRCKKRSDLDLSWFENTTIWRHVCGSRPPKAIRFIPRTVERHPN